MVRASFIMALLVVGTTAAFSAGRTELRCAEDSQRAGQQEVQYSAVVDEINSRLQNDAPAVLVCMTNSHDVSFGEKRRVVEAVFHLQESEPEVLDHTPAEQTTSGTLESLFSDGFVTTYVEIRAPLGRWRLSQNNTVDLINVPKQLVRVQEIVDHIAISILKERPPSVDYRVSVLDDPYGEEDTER